MGNLSLAERNARVSVADSELCYELIDFEEISRIRVPNETIKRDLLPRKFAKILH